MKTCNFTITVDIPITVSTINLAKTALILKKNRDQFPIDSYGHSMIKHPNQPKTSKGNQNKINVPLRPSSFGNIIGKQPKIQEKKKENHIHKVYGHKKTPFTI